MRPKVVLGIFLAAACIVALLVMLPKAARQQPPLSTASTPPPASPSAPAADAMPVTAPPPAPVAAAPATVTNTVAMDKQKHAEYVKKRADELMAIAMLNDTASHQAIIQELTNSDHAIRKVALEAVQQTQDRALIPEIQQIADTTDDDDYKEALEDAIAYMKLPTLTEVMQQRKAQQNGSANPPSQPAQQ